MYYNKVPVYAEETLLTNDGENVLDNMVCLYVFLFNMLLIKYTCHNHVITEVLVHLKLS